MFKNMTPHVRMCMTPNLSIDMTRNVRIDMTPNVRPKTPNVRSIFSIVTFVPDKMKIQNFPDLSPTFSNVQFFPDFYCFSGLLRVFKNFKVFPEF